MKVCNSKHGSLPPSCPTRVPSPNYLPPYLHLTSYTPGGVGKEGGTLVEIYINVSGIPKRGSKVPVYKGGILTIYNINSGSNSTEMSDICNLTSLREVRYDRDTTK